MYAGDRFKCMLYATAPPPPHPHHQSPTPVGCLRMHVLKNEFSEDEKYHNLMIAHVVYLFIEVIHGRGLHFFSKGFIELQSF